MSMFKLAVYGGIGYLVYQMFFSDMPRGTARMRGGRQGGRQSGAGEQQGFGASSGGSQRMSGGGGGMSERTEEPSGTATTHQVGRGVVP